MSRKRAQSAAWLALVASFGLQQAAAQDVPPASTARPAEQHAERTAPALSSYFDALRKKRFLPAEPAKLAELRTTLARAEALALAGEHEDAALLLFELVESPRFADYSDEHELDAARYLLGGALHELGAEESARHYLRKVLDKGRQGAYFAPAFRRYADVALAGLDLAQVIAELGALPLALPEDAQNELRYLRAREREAAGDDELAARTYAEITKSSRFYASAQYLLGALSARHGKLNDAERRFCSIASAGKKDRYSFFVDQRYFAIKDLARLGLGRVAHELRRGDDAFYYYFQVPQDSPRLPEALFEAAYATYENGDPQTALDLLDQLQTRFAGSAFSDEASLLRGYVALARCDFQKASNYFAEFLAHFEPLLAEIDRILASPARREALDDELSGAEARQAGASPLRKPLLALLGNDPVFQSLHQSIRKLDAEAARAGRVPELLAAIAARLSGSDLPQAAQGAELSERAELAQLQGQLLSVRAAVQVLTQELDTMREHHAKNQELAALGRDIAALEGRLGKAQAQSDDARFALMGTGSDAAIGGEVLGLLSRDVQAASAFERRVASTRARLRSAANEHALSSLSALRGRLAGFLRRAQIGRVDAVMGSKRRIEAQIESLAAGRLPAGLRNPLLVQGFLADDEEYWPFEGEEWPDEYQERGDKAGEAGAHKRAAPERGKR